MLTIDKQIFYQDVNYESVNFKWSICVWNYIKIKNVGDFGIKKFTMFWVGKGITFLEIILVGPF